MMSGDSDVDRPKPPHQHSTVRSVAARSLALAAIVAACSGDPLPPDTDPAEVLITAIDTLRSIGASATLTATARNASHQAIPDAVVSRWESSDPAIVTVHPLTGFVTAIANGEVTVKAHARAAVGYTRVVVRQRIDASKSTITVGRPLLFVGDTTRVTLRLRDAGDSPVRVNSTTIVLSSTGGTSGLTPGHVVEREIGTYTSDFVGGAVGTARTIGAAINGTILLSSGPTLQVVGFTKIAAESSGPSLTCGLVTTGDIYCWGEPTGTVRGTGVFGATAPSPTLVAGGVQWTDVDVGQFGGCGITDNAKLYCWGDARLGSLGNGAMAGAYPLPVSVLRDSSFVAVDVGLANGTCAITTGHTAMCWSLGSWGRLGNGADALTAVPVRVSGGHKFAAIATSLSGSCGVTDAGVAMCWGHYSTLGIALEAYPDNCSSQGPTGEEVLVPCAKTPVVVSGGITFKPIIFHGGNEVCAIATDNKTYCWGPLGGKVPTELAGAPVFTAIATGDMDNCGVAQSGTAYCWGTNRNGRFGMPPDINELHLVPEPVPGGQRFTQLSMGQNHMCGIATDGNAWCWGSNAKGELGDRTTTPSAVPVRVKLFAP